MTDIKQYKKEKQKKQMAEIDEEIRIMESVDMEAAVAGMMQRVDPKDQPFLARYNQKQYEKARPYLERVRSQWPQVKAQIRERRRKDREAAHGKS